jgi:hypothetical protein
MPMEKIDLRKELKYLYTPKANKVQIVDVPEFKFIMIDGVIAPGESPSTSIDYQEAIQALYGAAYTLKFMSKLNKAAPIDFSVMALEGLWWIADGEFDFRMKVPWYWTMMILQPEHISQAMFTEALAQLNKKRESESISRLRLESFYEGPCMQIMHIGPYADEPGTIEKMKTFAWENGYIACGKHHEIYLGDPRRVQPEKLKTILRHPIELPRV